MRIINLVILITFLSTNSAYSLSLRPPIGKIKPARVEKTTVEIMLRQKLKRRGIRISEVPLYKYNRWVKAISPKELQRAVGEAWEILKEHPYFDVRYIQPEVDITYKPGKGEIERHLKKPSRIEIVPAEEPTKIDPLEMPLFYDIDTAGGIEKEELVREVRIKSSYKFCVVVDQVFELVNLTGEAAVTRVVVFKEAVEEDSVDNRRILSLLNKASALGLPGASALLKLYKNGNVIFIKASYVLEPYIEPDPNSDVLDRTVKELNMSMLWYGKILSVLRQKQHSVRFADICNAIAGSDSETVKELLRLFSWDAEEVIAMIPRFFRDKEVGEIIDEAVRPKELAEFLKDLYKKTRPSEEEIEELRNAARVVYPSINEFNYASIVKGTSIISRIFHKGKMREVLSFI